MIEFKKQNILSTLFCIFLSFNNEHTSVVNRQFHWIYFTVYCFWEGEAWFTRGTSNPVGKCQGKLFGQLCTLSRASHQRVCSYMTFLIWCFTCFIKLLLCKLFLLLSFAMEFEGREWDGDVAKTISGSPCFNLYRFLLAVEEKGEYEEKSRPERKEKKRGKYSVMEELSSRSHGGFSL